MCDKDRSKEDLINELNELRSRNRELELYVKESLLLDSSGQYKQGSSLSEREELRKGENKLGHRSKICLNKSKFEVSVKASQISFVPNLEEINLLKNVSTEFLYKDNIQALYEIIIDTAMQIMGSDYASMQMIYPAPDGGSKLNLLAYRGFTSEAAKFWEWVDLDSASSCGQALREAQRVMTPNVEECDFLQGTDDLECYQQTGIYAVQSTPLFSRSGKLLGMISTHWSKPHNPSEREFSLLDIVARQAADLIEQKKAEENLREGEERYRTLFESMNEGFFLAQLIYDELGNPTDYLYLAANPALEKILGLKHKDIVGRTRSSILKTKSSWIEIFNKVAETAKPITFEGFSEGLQRYFMMNVYSPKKGQFACLIQDITGRRVLEEKLKSQQDQMLQTEIEKNDALKKVIEMKDEFLIIISHEFKTPLNVIYAALQAINNLYSDELSDKVKKHLGRIRTNCFRQLRLVNNLLDITRYNAGYIKIQEEILDIVFLSKAIAESVIPFAKLRELEIHFSSEIDCMEMAIDEEKFERILLNLLSNAIKFSPRKRSIFVEVTTNKNMLVISVMDEGVGIPLDKQEYIFERFGQVDSTLTRQAEGTGIGLSLVKVLVSALRGNINLESEVGKGSIFTVELPIKHMNGSHSDEKMSGQTSNRVMKAVEIEFSDIYAS